MSIPTPRTHYLYVHDALRAVFGKANVELSAFVKQKHPFQCDMVINSPRTDLDVLQGDKDKVQAIVKDLQAHLGSCTLRGHASRIDIVFRDQAMIQLALGAPKSWLNNLRETKGINDEPDWRKRNRLRISLGFDESLFTAGVSLGTSLAAHTLEKRCYSYYKHSPVLDVLPGNLREQFDEDYHNVLPPVTYWLAHCHALSQAYPVRHYIELESTVHHNFARYYQTYPFDNPYCKGEDLNTMACAKLLCTIWQQASISGTDDVFEVKMPSNSSEQEEEAEAADASAEPTAKQRE